MKSQNEFLNGVWNKVDELEYEERVNQIAFETNRQFKIETAKAYCIIIMFILISILLLIYFKKAVYFIAIALFIIGYFTQYKIDNLSIRKEATIWKIK